MPFVAEPEEGGIYKGTVVKDRRFRRLSFELLRQAASPRCMSPRSRNRRLNHSLRCAQGRPGGHRFFFPGVKIAGLRRSRARCAPVDEIVDQETGGGRIKRKRKKEAGIIAPSVPKTAPAAQAAGPFVDRSSRFRSGRTAWALSSRKPLTAILGAAQRLCEIALARGGPYWCRSRATNFGLGPTAGDHTCGQVH